MSAQFFEQKIFKKSFRVQDNTSVMTKVTATLGRNFIKSKEFQEAQLMGLDSSIGPQNGGSSQSASMKDKQRSIRY
jgi:myosin-7